MSNLDYLENALKVRAAYHIVTTMRLIDNSKEPKTVKQNELFATDV